MNKNDNNQSSVISFIDVLTLIFIVLKLTGNIDWSWWWVLSPIWLPIAAYVALLLIALIINAIIDSINN